MKPRELSQDIRRILVQEIERWEREKIIYESQAKMLRCEYDFDFKAPPVMEEPPPIPTELISPPPAATPAPEPTPKPHLTLAQALLSETSIRIALYLGAFFVVAAALILAALVAVLRLPVLATAAVCFGAGAVVLKRRLPQPSFILYMVFLTMIPIISGVLAELLKLRGTAANTYWFFILAGFTIILAFSTRLYASRFFSLVALAAFDAAMIMLGGTIIHAKLIQYLFFLTLPGLVALGGVFLLWRWQGRYMSLPLRIMAQAQEALILMVTVVAMMTGGIGRWGGIFAATFLSIFAFLILINYLYPFFLYSWLAAGVLSPIAWLLTRGHVSPEVMALITGVWGASFSVTGNIFKSRWEKLRSYALPASIAGMMLMVIGAISGIAHNQWLGLGLCIGAALVLWEGQVFHKQRWFASITIGLALGAYFIFFSLPFFKGLEDFWTALFAGAVMLLLLPDLFLSKEKLSNWWRWPLRAWAILGGLLVFVSGVLTSIFSHSLQSTVGVITLFLIGVFYLAYGIRLRQAWIGIFFCIHLTAALTVEIVRDGIHGWVPILCGLAVLYYAAGFLLKRTQFKGWSWLFRWSGLVLAGIMSLAILASADRARSLYVFAMGILFLIETFQSSEWLESVPPAIFSLALGMVLFNFIYRYQAYLAAGSACFFLGLDLIYSRLKERSDLRWLTFSLGILAAFLTPFMAAFRDHRIGGGAIACGLVVAITLAQALINRKEYWRYAALAYFSLVILFGSLYFFPKHWLWPLISTSIVFYGLSTVIGRLKAPEWDTALRFSGLGLASLTALSAPFERSGLIACLPVALAATLWAVEALRRRNVWLGFPANALYLMAYFMILSTLKVEQAQVYSVGAALLGMLMHYLLLRAGSKTGAFIMGMISQLVLIGTSYIQFVDTEQIWYFVVLFFESLAVLTYGIIIRSRSLVITPIILVILGVITIVFGVLRGLSTVILVGTTGLALIVLGIMAMFLRERITTLRDQMKKWNA